MAKEELETITEDKWGEEIWGVARSGNGKPDDSSKMDDTHVMPGSRLIFYFGEKVVHPRIWVKVQCCRQADRVAISSF